MASAGVGASTPEDGGDGEATPPSVPEPMAGEAAGSAEQGTGDSETG